MDDLQDLAAAYVLDALDDEERAAFERYLLTHPDVQREVEQLREGASVLGDASSEEPPATMRDAVLAATAVAPQEPMNDTVVPLRRTRRWQQIAAAVAAVLVLVLGIGAGVILLGGESRVETILAAPDARTLEITGGSVDGSFTYSLAEQGGVFTSATVPPVGGDETYALWLIGDAGPRPAGLFVPSASGAVEAVVEGELDPGVTLGLTVEPAGGSDAPTGAILFAEPIP